MDNIRQTQKRFFRNIKNKKLMKGWESGLFKNRILNQKYISLKYFYAEIASPPPKIKTPSPKEKGVTQSHHKLADKT